MKKKTYQMIDDLVNQIMTQAKNRHELLIGECSSHAQLSDTQEHILLLIAQNGALENLQIAKLLKLTPAAVTKATKVLLSHGFISVVKDEKDSRRLSLQLANSALPIVKEHEKHHKFTTETYKKIANDFSADEQEIIQRFLSELTEVLS